MENLLSTTSIAAGSALFAGASYLDAHYGISRDIGQILADRRMGKRIEQRIKQVGEYASVYGHMQTADPNAEGLWFEGRSWTYAEILKRMSAFWMMDIIAKYIYRCGCSSSDLARPRRAEEQLCCFVHEQYP